MSSKHVLISYNTKLDGIHQLLLEILKKICYTKIPTSVTIKNRIPTKLFGKIPTTKIPTLVFLLLVFCRITLKDPLIIRLPV